MIKRFIQLVCETLEIEIPKVSYDTSKFRTETMMAYCDGETIYVKNLKNPTPDVFLLYHMSFVICGNLKLIINSTSITIKKWVK